MDCGTKSKGALDPIRKVGGVCIWCSTGCPILLVRKSDRPETWKTVWAQAAGGIKAESFHFEEEVLSFSHSLHSTSICIICPYDTSDARATHVMDVCDGRPLRQDSLMTQWLNAHVSDWEGRGWLCRVYWVVCSCK